MAGSPARAGHGAARTLPNRARTSLTPVIFSRRLACAGSAARVSSTPAASAAPRIPSNAFTVVESQNAGAAMWTTSRVGRSATARVLQRPALVLVDLACEVEELGAPAGSRGRDPQWQSGGDGVLGSHAVSGRHGQPLLVMSLLWPGGFVQGTALTERTRSARRSLQESVHRLRPRLQGRLPVRSAVRGGLLVVLGAAELFVEA
ncbi:hypothetical protein BX265_7490 [Streptomyces sp. TLI_235]|nr:hypothetical protein BX265_7490 [Streptomyces sp. TLI_235]